ncbi:hypothetical protein B0H15DRAFT_1020862 [Mycena belliarum]|uniref:Ubiquitin-like protease family profile domain-containing protein n=1 Tax=Mycena belliarum TaxID=1033014 RepID=A0AAD6U6E6_9AGAR|nr:hypothetical protein B0H15DRAFT_1020862 [Mycena belliae]
MAYSEIIPVDCDEDAAHHRILEIPLSTKSRLPSKSMPLSYLILYDLPLVAPCDGSVHSDMLVYTRTEPTQDIDDLLPFLTVPTRSAVQKLATAFGQALVDGNKSIRTSLNPDVVYPLWALTYWAEILDACEAKDIWLHAESWLNSAGGTDEERRLKLMVRGLWNIVGWHGSLRGFAGVPKAFLAKLLSDEYLDSKMVDAMLLLLSLRSRIAGEETLIIGTTFSEFVRLLPPVVDGVPAGPITSSSGGLKYLKKYGVWFQDSNHKRLYTVLFRPPDHWTVCLVDFEGNRIRYGDGLGWSRPRDFFEGLESWIGQHHEAKFEISEDLPCAHQTDGFSCPIIAVNAIAHNEFGDTLWTQKDAKVLRMKAFCDILKHALAAERIASKPVPAISDPTDLAENLLSVDVDINDELYALPSIAAPCAELAEDSQDIEMGEAEEDPDKALLLSSRKGSAKRRADSIEDAEEPERKIPRTVTAVRDPDRVASRSTDLGLRLGAKTASKSTGRLGTQKPDLVDRASVGLSASATTTRNQRTKIKNGTFKPSATKTKNFREKCRTLDSGATFEPNSKEVQCSICKVWVKMKEPYNTSRFRDHAGAPCAPPPPPARPVNTLDASNFFTRVAAARPKPKERPKKISAPCRGLTAIYDELVGIYLNRTAATGGGARAVGHYSQELFKKPFTELGESHKTQVLTAQMHGRTWKNDTSPGIIATFSVKCLGTVQVDPGSDPSLSPCHECVLVHTSRAYQNAIHKPEPESKNYRFVPHAHQNKTAGMLYARFQGLEELMSEENSHSLERRYINHVLNGDFKDDKLFNGIIEAKILGKTREIKGLGNQNFKHNEDVDAVFGLIHAISPRAYREIAKHIPLRTERSIKDKISRSPRFPVGIQDTTFEFVEKYSVDYQYPRGAPLSLAVDDTKLFSALRPLYDGVKKKWFIVGAIGDPIEVHDIDGLHATLDRLERDPPPMATKLRLWTLQIPLPRVPPLILAIMPIESKVKGPQLAEWQIALMKGLISRGFRITSSGSDGASVERDCHRRLAAASKLLEFRIKHPDPDYPDIIVELWELDGNVWVIFQDAKHGRKTFRNNAASGARGIVLGNFLVYFEQMYTLATQPGSPMYLRDWRKRDRMDDPAAARLSSADTLEQAAQDPTKNLGLVVYLFVFGEIIDAYQSRTISHHERAKIAIRTRLFLRTWRLYLQKAGYSEARHFISKEAYDIFEILVNGILGLIIIHRDHLGDQKCPLLPWFNASDPNEHSFSGLRDISEDFTLQEAILSIPKLRTKMEAAVRAAVKTSDLKKQASGYSHTYYTRDDIDFALLGQYPTDLELSTAYEIATEENNCLWSLLGIHPRDIERAPDPGATLISQPSPDPEFEALFLDEEADATVDASQPTAAEELQRVVDSLKNVANISRAGDEELDACVMASVALSMDELAKIEDLPESNPARFAEIQSEIAHAMATQPTAFVALLQGIAASATPDSAIPLRPPHRHDLSLMFRVTIFPHWFPCGVSIKHARRRWGFEPTTRPGPIRITKLELRNR